MGQNNNVNTKGNTISVVIVNAQEYLFQGEAEMVVATAYSGEVGIKPRHTPFLALLKPGQAVVYHNNSEEIFYVSGGVLEVQPNLITILADHAERAKDIDEAKAEQARKEAEKNLLDKNAKLDYAKLQVELAQSLAQLRALRRFKNQAQKRRS